MEPLDVVAFFGVFARAFVQVLAGALIVTIIVRVLLSWVQVSLPLGLADLVYGISEGVLGPIRRVLPFMGGLDLSPLVAIILIQVLERIVLTLLRSVGL